MKSIDSLEINPEIKELFSKALENFSEKIKENPALFPKEELIELADKLVNETNPENFIRDEENPIEYLQKNLNKSVTSFFKNETGLYNLILDFFKCKENKNNLDRIKLFIEDPRIYSQSIDQGISFNKKPYFNLDFTTQKAKQEEILNKIIIGNNEIDKTFIYAKIYTKNSMEHYIFFTKVLEILKNFLILKSNNLLSPDFKIFIGQNCLYLQLVNINCNKFEFYMGLLKLFLNKIPNYNISIKLACEFGKNIRDLINDHTENTIFDLLRGSQFRLDFLNNISDVFKIINKNFYDGGNPSLLILSFLLGSVTLYSGMELSLAFEQLKVLFGDFLNLNVFDKNSYPKNLKKYLKNLKDNNPWYVNLAPILKSLEERIEFIAHSPLGTIFLNFDVDGALELLENVMSQFDDLDEIEGEIEKQNLEEIAKEKLDKISEKSESNLVINNEEKEELKKNIDEKKKLFKKDESKYNNETVDQVKKNKDEDEEKELEIEAEKKVDADAEAEAEVEADAEEEEEEESEEEEEAEVDAEEEEEEEEDAEEEEIEEEKDKKEIQVKNLENRNNQITNEKLSKDKNKEKEECTLDIENFPKEKETKDKQKDEKDNNELSHEENYENAEDLADLEDHDELDEAIKEKFSK